MEIPGGGVITVDADGQHTLEDVKKVSDRMKKLYPNEALILGERIFDHMVPFRSKFGNNCTRFLFRLLYGIKLNDTQTGLRGIPNSMIDIFVKLDGMRYEYEMNMLAECAVRKVPIESVMIKTVYIDNNVSSHFNVLKDSFRIYKMLLATFLRFAFSSFSASLVDMAIFQILVFLLRGSFTGSYIYVATVGARAISSSYNFFINKKVVFKSNDSITCTGIKYFLLCILQMLLSAFLVNLLFSIFRLPELLMKIFVDTVLFFISFRVQKNLIFADKKRERA